MVKLGDSMSREWDDRMAGKMPVIPDEGINDESQSGVSCLSKGLTAKVLQSATLILAAILYKKSFMIPGMGESSEYCMKKIVNSLSTLGNALKATILKCERIQCPNCYEWWISERTFALAVLIESYAKVTGERPAALSVSVHPDTVRKWTWQDYGRFFRTSYNRLEKIGIIAGIRVFHPFRILYHIKGKLRELGHKKGGFWKAIRNNELNLKNWYEYITLSPHLHIIGFPNWIKENLKADIVINKYGTLESVNDTVGHLRYLLSHCGILTNGENEPASEFGALHGFKPEKFLSTAEILDIKNNVASAMGLIYNPDKDCIEMKKEEEKPDKYEWIPLHKFADYSQDNVEFTSAYIGSIKNEDNAQYVADIINLYNDRLRDKSRKAFERHVFIDDLEPPPDTFEFVIVDRDKHD